MPMSLALACDASSVGGAAASPSFDPASLFAGGYTGFWIDPSDLSSVFTDSAGTTPGSVDAVVGRSSDKSGNGAHWTQTTTSSKPFLRSSSGLNYLSLDGVDDYLLNASIQFGLTNFSLFMAAQETSSKDNAGFLVAKTAGGSDFSGSDAVAVEAGDKAITCLDMIGAPAASMQVNAIGTGATPLAVWEFIKTGGVLTLYRDGVSQQSDSSFTALDALSAGGGYIGIRYLSSSPNTTYCLAGRIYQMLFINRTLSAGERTSLRANFTTKAGL